MKFDRTLRPWLAASTDESRIHLVNLMLDVEKKRLLATNGHILVSVPVAPGPGDKSGLLSVACVKWAHGRAEHDGSDEAFIDCTSKSVAVVGDVTFKRPSELDKNVGKFPPAYEIFPKFEKGEKLHVFALDANYLIKLANALGKGEPGEDHSATVRLTVRAKDEMLDVIQVEVQDGVDGAIGLLMPRKP